MGNKIKKKKSEHLVRIIKNKSLIIGIIMLSILIFIAVFGPLLTTYGYEEMNTGPRLTPPSREHFCGTDQFGRDLFTRVLYGARYSLLISILIVMFSNMIGIPIGTFSGYLGGKFDIFMMRIVDIIFTIPWFLLGMIIAVSIGRGPKSVIVALSIVYSPQIARIVRGCTLALKEKEFVQAGKISGENILSILFRYILSNSFGPIVVQSTMVLAYSMLSEAALSYLGYGIAPPIPSWGLLLQDATRYYISHSYLVYFPGFAIVFGVLTFSFLGDGLRDLFDPKFTPM